MSRKKSKKKAPTEVLRTKFTSVHIDPTETPWKDDTKEIGVKVVTAEDERFIGLVRTITVHRSDDLYLKRNQVRNRLRNAIDEICAADLPEQSLSALFYRRTKDLSNLSAWYDLCPALWRSDRHTTDPAIRYFAAHALQPISDAIAAGCYGPDVAQRVANEILKDVMKNQAVRDAARHTEEGIDEKTRVARAKPAANLHIRNCNEIFSRLRDQADYPDAYPVIVLPLYDDVQCIPPEQCKALPPEALITFAALLRLSVAKNPLSFGGALMMCSMVRTAEAVCPKYKEILVMGGYAVYGVIWQSDGQVRVADLKTESSYRLVILPYFAVHCLALRRAQLKLHGYTDNEIDELYVVSAPDDPYKPAKPGRLSAYIRTLLSLAGDLDTNYWGAAYELMRKEPDPVSAYAKAGELLAYILRRSGCTYLCNCSGCDPRLVDVVMGHLLRREDSAMADKIKAEDMWPIIADHMECIIYDPAYSANPAYMARTGDRSTGVPHRRVKIRITEDMIRDGKVIFNVETLRPDEVLVTLPKEATVSKHSAVDLVHDATKYPVIWEELDPQVFARCIQQAEKIYENNREVFVYGK